MIRYMTFRIRFAVEPDGDEFHAYCPDLKGLHVSGATQEEALSNARVAVECYLQSLIKHSDPIPVGLQAEHGRLSTGTLFRMLWEKFLPRRREFFEEIQLKAA